MSHRAAKESQKQKDDRAAVQFGGANESQKQKDCSLGGAKESQKQKEGRRTQKSGLKRKAKEPLDSIAPKLYAAGRKQPFSPEDNHISLRTAYLKLPGANKTGAMRDPKKREAVAK